MGYEGKIIPKQVIIEVTNACNLKCRYCPNTGDEHAGKMMSLEQFKNIVDRIDFKTTVIPWMNGEPFLNAEYLEMCKYLSDKRHPYYVTTNLTIWRNDIIKYLLSDDSTCYQLIISMDGIPESGNIEKARPGVNQEKFLENLYRLFDMKRMLGSKKDLAVKICERGQDWEEIETYIRRYLNWADYVCVGKPLVTLNEVCMRSSPCQYFDNNFMVIRQNGDCVICAYNGSAANDRIGCYGNVFETYNLIELYNNDIITERREKQKIGEYLEPCDKCGFAYTGMGMKGVVQFRSDPEGKLYHFRQDYYNQFYSLKNKEKPDDYYRIGWEKP